MAERKVKCRYCNEFVPISTATLVKNIKQRQYVCIEHELLYQKKLQEKQKKTSNFRKITDYIQHIYVDILEMENNDISWDRLIKELNTLVAKGYKEEGILLTLHYAVEVIGIEWKKLYGVAQIVSNYYDDAKQYFITTKQILRLCDEFEEDDTVNISVSPRTNNTHEQFFIDLDKL